MDVDDQHAIIALPGWWSSIAEAEAQSLPSINGMASRAACTHVADGIALVTVEVSGSGRPSMPAAHTDRWASMARTAIGDHEAHYGGRLFVFPGQTELRECRTAGEVLERSVIDELVVPGHPGGIPADAPIEGLDYVRPVFRQGQVVLTLRPVRPGVFQPFERRRPVGALRPLH